MVASSQIYSTHQQNAAVAHFSCIHAMKRVLLVDSQAHVLRVMKSALDRNGYDVETAMSADVALGMLRESHFDVLLIDDGLEKLDGQQLIDTIDDQLGDCAPVMFLVTDEHAGDMQQWCAQFDRTECLERPISLGYLAERLNELLDF